ncbi:MAG: outer membrane lipoprotein chaperone LolA [Gammaproteobacteria bacterium]|nr:MAG: outer membrane lipoprotein chaperone LolA [Gammaproteobacteria bacterium]
MKGWLQIFLCIATLWSTSLYATDADQMIRQYLTDVESFQASFTQSVVSMDEPHSDESHGTMAFRRPGSFHWAYEDPYEQLIVSDGMTLWIYDKDLEQVTVRPVGQKLDKTPIMLLDAPDKLSDDYALEVILETGDEVEISLIPKGEEPGFKRVILHFSNSILVGMEIQDNFDHLNRLFFSDVKQNAMLDDDFFNFVPPDGVDVIRAADEFE